VNIQCEVNQYSSFRTCGKKKKTGITSGVGRLLTPEGGGAITMATPKRNYKKKKKSHIFDEFSLIFPNNLKF
jgi:hypothetical protein